MSNKVQIDQTVLRILYYKYKEYVIPGIVFFVSWAIFIIFVFPQIQNFFVQKDAVVVNEQTLAVMTQNYNIVAGSDTTQLQNELTIANAALPSAKDFAGILNAISTAAGQSSVTVNDYTFQIGALTGKPTRQDESEVKINLTLNATLDQTKRFLVALSNQFPLSEVTNVSIFSNQTSGIDASFFYNALPNTPFDPGTPITSLTTVQKNMLNVLGKNQTLLPTVTITPSVSLTPTPSITPTSTPKIVTPTQPVSTTSAST